MWSAFEMFVGLLQYYKHRAVNNVIWKLNPQNLYSEELVGFFLNKEL